VEYAIQTVANSYAGILEAARRNAPRGTRQQVRDILAGMEDAGMSRFYFQGAFDPDAIELRLEKLT